VARKFRLLRVVRPVGLVTRVAERANKNHSFIHLFIRSFVRSFVLSLSLFFQVYVLAYVKIDISSLSIN